MKRSDTDFSIPVRQSYVAILMIIYKYYKIILRQLIPIILILFIGGKRGTDWQTYIIYAVIVLSIFSMGIAIIAYFRFYFYISDNELVVEKGVLQRKKTSIPFDRIQTINLEQNIIHKMFSVVKLEIDTAGTSKNEFEFDALKQDMAEDLRNQIMAWKKKQKKSIIAEEASDVNEEYKPILKIDILRLFKIGITENHIKSGVLIIVFFFWIWENLSQAGIDVNEYSETYPMRLASSIILILAILFVVVSLTISLIRTVLLYFDLSFMRSEDGFRVESGLLTRRNLTAKDHKIQMLTVNDNLLKKLLGFKVITLKQASSVEVGKKLSISIPGCDDLHVQSVLDSLYGLEVFQPMDISSVHIKYFIRRATYTVIASTVIFVLGWYIEIPWMMTLSVIMCIYIIVTGWIKYKKAGYGINAEMLRINGGIFGDRSVFFPLYKIQAVELSQNIYQRRHGLASVDIFTASGGESIPYIELEIARKLTDYILFRAENDSRKWM